LDNKLEQEFRRKFSNHIKNEHWVTAIWEWLAIQTNYKSFPLDAEVSNDFCGLTAIERKELEVIWNKLTNYGKQKMTYDKYLDAGLEIMTMAYLTGKNKSKNSR